QRRMKISLGNINTKIRITHHIGSRSASSTLPSESASGSTLHIQAQLAQQAAYDTVRSQQKTTRDGARSTLQAHGLVGRSGFPPRAQSLGARFRAPIIEPHQYTSRVSAAHLVPMRVGKLRLPYYNNTCDVVG